MVCIKKKKNLKKKTKTWFHCHVEDGKIPNFLKLLLYL